MTRPVSPVLPADAHLGARILVFPARPAAPAAADPHAGRDRLARALAALEQAIAAQRQAVGCWQDQMRALDAAMDGLAGTVGAYQDRLSSVSASVAALGRQAEMLATR
ncbi:MAG: hypothetical protein KGL12_15385 [Rhodospirillales bacterium]|nr:hypothetical protein [Rhodospirillales bacterium]